MSNASLWRIPDLDVEQGHFQHQGFEGSLRLFLERVRLEILEAKHRYPEHTWKSFDDFLISLEQVLSGDSGMLTLEIRDPSGLSHVDAALEPKQTTFERSVRDDWALGVLYPRPTIQGHTAASVARWIRKSSRIVALTGAGISVESGITPFRSSDKKGEALWAEFDPTRMTLGLFNRDPTVQAEWWQLERKLMGELSKAEPNAAHQFFGMLEQQGKLHGVITQNIDSLHQKGGVPDSKMNELHGHLRRVICANQRSRLNPQPCGDGACDFEPIRFEDVEPTILLPTCPKCSAPLRSETVMFEQSMPEGAVESARAAVREADLLIVVGSTLRVAPANELPAEALRRGTPVILVNFDETRYDEQVHVLVRQPAGELFAEVSALLQRPEEEDEEVEVKEDVHEVVAETSTHAGTWDDGSEEEQLYGDDDVGD